MKSIPSRLSKKKKKKTLTTLVNFSIRSAFSKGPGPGLGLLFKEPQNIGENKMLFSQWQSRVKIHGRILMNVNEIYCNQRIYGVYIFARLLGTRLIQ